MIELEQLRQFADIAAIRGDRDCAVRLHVLIGAIENLTLRLDALEVAHGLAAVERREDQRLNA